MSLTAEQVRVAMDNPEDLQRWLVESGRKYVLMNANHLVASLMWPGEETPGKATVVDLQRVIEQYKQFRQLIPTGKMEEQTDERGRPAEVPIMMGEVLEVEEKLELFHQLKSELREAGVLS